MGNKMIVNTSAKNLEKDIAKVAGKALATIACPVVGGALWGKSFASRTGGGALGFLAGVSLTIGMGINGTSKIYDNPSIHTEAHGIFSISKEFGLVATVGMILSPPLFSAVTYPMTYAGEGKDMIKIEGDKVFTYEPEFNQFLLSFPQHREFEYNGMKYSLVESEEKVMDYSQSLKDYLAKGDILNARATRKMLNGAEADFTIAKSAYEQAYTKLRGHMDKMNTEIRELEDKE